MQKSRIFLKGEQDTKVSCLQWIMRKEYLVSAKEMQKYDKNTIETIGIPSVVLMERAAFAVAMEALDMLALNTDKRDMTVDSIVADKVQPRVLIVAGNGNNGADGVCAGRILKEYGIECDVCLLKKELPYVEELHRQLSIAEYYQMEKIQPEDINFPKYDLIIDAILGVGLNREIAGTAKEIIGMINESQIPVLSVDIPSGIDATSGAILGCAIKASHTVTFGFYKRGQFFYPGKIYCGMLKKAKIAINETAFFDEEPGMFMYRNYQDKVECLMRDPMGNKGTFGKVFVIAGRASTTGAAVLCASSALRSGCGMVAVLTEKENKAVFLQTLPEIMVETYVSDEVTQNLHAKIQKWMDWSDVIVMGCGLLQDEIAYDMLVYVLAHTNKTVVLDADALQLIAKNLPLQDLVRECSIRLKAKEQALVFTPHPGELASLLKCSISQVKENRFGAVEKVLERYPVILIAKDADTLVCGKDEKWYLNTTGNDGLSTAGSGDVLAGLTASMLAQNRKKKISSFESVCQSVYLHGMASDYLTQQNGKSFLVASDLIEAYKYILK